MRLVELIGTSTYLIEYRGKKWTFVKGKIQQVPPLLAEKLLASGDFVDVITTIPEFAQGGIIANTLSSKEPIEHIAPLSCLPKDFNKLEISEDIKKYELSENDKIDIRNRVEKFENTKRKRRRKKEKE